MTRLRIRSVLVTVALIVTVGPARGQVSTPPRFAVGITLVDHFEGGFLAPSISRSFGGQGVIQGRVATSLAMNAMPASAGYACPSISGVFCDTRALGMTASSTVAIEVGTPRREIVGGVFVEAHGGIAAIRWRSGGFVDRTGPIETYDDYRGRTTMALNSGFAAGVDVPLGARPLRLQLGVDVLHDRWRRTPSVTVGVVHRW